MTRSGNRTHGRGVLQYRLMNHRGLVPGLNESFQVVRLQGFMFLMNENRLTLGKLQSRLDGLRRTQSPAMSHDSYLGKLADQVIRRLFCGIRGSVIDHQYFKLAGDIFHDVKNILNLFAECCFYIINRQDNTEGSSQNKFSKLRTARKTVCVTPGGAIPA